jgi:hypothetical protein
MALRPFLNHQHLPSPLRPWVPSSGYADAATIRLTRPTLLKVSDLSADQAAKDRQLKKRTASAVLFCWLF